MKIITRRAARHLLILLIVGAGVCVYLWATMIRMPGKSFGGELPPWTQDERVLADDLQKSVRILAGEIGERNIWTPENYRQAADFIQERFESFGYKVRRDEYEVQNVLCSNLEVEIEGNSRPDEILVIGAHYDSVPDCPGANDNASGVAGVLALASLMREAKPARSIRFVAFANEEAPFFHTEAMGSRRYAEQAQESGENIVGMISLETIGYFSEEPGSQQYPFPFNLFYPSRGNFIGFITHTRSPSTSLLRETVAVFRKEARLPSEGASIPERVPGTGWSDHWAFWQAGYPALMVTDTAPYRYPHYHTAKDIPEKLDYLRMTRVVKGMEAVMRALAESGD